MKTINLPHCRKRKLFEWELFAALKSCLTFMHCGKNCADLLSENLLNLNVILCTTHIGAATHNLKL